MRKANIPPFKVTSKPSTNHSWDKVKKEEK
jgi:hypothetical protein